MARAGRGMDGAALAIVWVTLAACADAPPPPAPEPAPAMLRVLTDPLLLGLSRDLLGIAADLDGTDPRPEAEASAFAALLRGEVDVVFALRAPTPDEQREAAGRDVVAAETLRSTTVARDELVLVVPEESPLLRIPRAGAAELLSGRRAEWDGLAGSGPVTLLVPPRGSSTWGTLREAFPGLEGAPPGLKAQPSDGEIARLTAATPGALGVCSRAVARSVRVLGIEEADGVLRPGGTDWPLTRPILLVTRGPLPRAARIVAAARSEAGRAAVRRRGFTPLPAEASPR